jgi:tetratricopeptide (TPR) repeat protein
MKRLSPDEIHEALRRAWDDANPSDQDLARLDAQVFARLAELDPHTLDPHESNVIEFPSGATHRVRTRSEMRLVQRPQHARRWIAASVAASLALVLAAVGVTRAREHRPDRSPVATRPATTPPAASPTTSPPWQEVLSPDARWEHRADGAGGVLHRGAVTLSGHHDPSRAYAVGVPAGPFEVQPIGTRAQVEVLTTSMRVHVTEGAVRVVCVGPSPTTLATLREGEREVFPFECERYRGDGGAHHDAAAHALFEAAHQANEAGSHDEALALLDRLLASHPDHRSVPNAYLLRGRIRCARGRIEEGRGDLAQARSRDPVIAAHALERERECVPRRP